MVISFKNDWIDKTGHTSQIVGAIRGPLRSELNLKHVAKSFRGKRTNQSHSVNLLTTNIFLTLLLPSHLFGNAMKYFVAKLVKSFGGLCNTAESLDDFRYRKACFQQRKMLHSALNASHSKRGISANENTMTSSPVTVLMS